MKYVKLTLISVLVLSTFLACGNTDEINPADSSQQELGNPVVTKIDIRQPKDNRENNQQNGQDRPIDYDAIAEVLDVSAEDLQNAVENNFSQGGLNFSDLALTLNVNEEDLIDAFNSIDGGFGPGKGNMPGQMEINYAAAAESLGVSEEDLRSAVEKYQSENGPIDFGQVANELNVNSNDLRSALGFQQGGRGEGSPN